MDDKLLKKMERIESILDADYKKDGTVDAVSASLKKAITHVCFCNVLWFNNKFRYALYRLII